MPKMKKTDIISIIVAVGLGAALLINGLLPKHTITKISKTIDNKSIISKILAIYPYSKVFCLDSKYATVNITWLTTEYYQEFRKELSRVGIINWSEQFDCDHFARYYTSYLETKYFSENFMNKSGPQSVAVGVVFYLVNGDENRGHAINCAIDDNDEIIIIEPQNGKIVILSDKEKESVFLVLW